MKKRLKIDFSGVGREPTPHFTSAEAERPNVDHGGADNVVGAKLRLSQSKVKLWRQCRYAYGLKYVDHLKANAKRRPLKFGTLVHAVLEADFDGVDWRKVLADKARPDMKLFAEEAEEYGDIVRSIEDIMDEYFRYWTDRHAVKPIAVNGKNSEHKFEIDVKELNGEVLWTGKLDGIVKRATTPALNFLMEHKTFKRKPTVDHRWRNIQSCTYRRAADIMGWPRLHGTCWDYINSKQPNEPEIIGKGTKLSARAITTLPVTVKRVLAANNFSEVHYASYLESVTSNLGDYFERVYQPFKEEVIEIVWRDFVASMKEIVALAGRDRSRNVAMHCDWCDYENICRAEFQGLDVDHVKQHYYHLNKDEYDNVEENAASE